MEIITNSTNETKELATKIAKKLKPSCCVLFYGDLGFGKTTFIRYLVESLGFKDRVQSPTFIILRTYNKISSGSKVSLPIKKVNHLDLYRLSNVSEFYDQEFDQLLNERDSITLIEWPHLVAKELEQSFIDVVKIKIEYLDENKRKFSISNL